MGIGANAYGITSPDGMELLVTNSDDYENLTVQTGACKILDKVIQI